MNVKSCLKVNNGLLYRTVSIKLGRCGTESGSARLDVGYTGSGQAGPDRGLCVCSPPVPVGR
jgi:hypothetical protein